MSVSSVDAADTICQNLAASAGLPSSSHFRVWLSTATSAAVTRLAGGGPWYVVGGGPTILGSRVAIDSNALSGGSLLRAIDTDQHGNQVAAGTLVWTGTTDQGILAPLANCKDWDGMEVSGADNGEVGDPSSLGPEWTDTTDDTCTVPHAFYCFQVP
jgi:hypothetical protein